MTQHLILTRHAKSAWDDPRLDDHARPLNARGRDAANAIGRWLAARGPIPDAALVSSAARARETWTRIATELPRAVPETVMPALYHAEPETMLRVLAHAHGACVMMIGHNPGIAAVAAHLLAQRPDHADFARYPTGATLIAGFEIADWAALAPGTGALQTFRVPRELG